MSLLSAFYLLFLALCSLLSRLFRHGCVICSNHTQTLFAFFFSEFSPYPQLPIRENWAVWFQHVSQNRRHSHSHLSLSHSFSISLSRTPAPRSLCLSLTHILQIPLSPIYRFFNSRSPKWINYSKLRTARLICSHKSCKKGAISIIIMTRRYQLIVFRHIDQHIRPIEAIDSTWARKPVCRKPITS